VTGPGGEPPSPDELTDALAHLAGALQRLDLTMTGIDRLPVMVIHALAAILETVPAVHDRPAQTLPPYDPEA